MNVRNKNWLEEFMNSYFSSISLEKNITRSNDLDYAKQYYTHFQPHGLFCANLVLAGENESIRSLQKKYSELVFLYFSALLAYQGVPQSEVELKSKAEQIKKFYRLYDKAFPFLSKKESKKNDLYGFLFRGIFKKTGMSFLGYPLRQKTLLFVDILLFEYYCRHEKEPDAVNINRIREHGVKYYKLLVNIVLAVMSSNSTNEKIEKRILHDLIKSNHGLRHLWKHNNSSNLIEKDLDKLDFSIVNTWLEKKYILELAIFIAFSDRMIEKEEMDFLNKLCGLLKLDDMDLQSGIINVETFMCENWDKLSLLRNKSHSGLILADVKHKMIGLGKKYKDSIITEIKESKELVQLIQKSREQELSAVEKEKVKKQLIDIFKTIPAISIFMLPGGSVILLALFEILPKELLPSGFKRTKK